MKPLRLVFDTNVLIAAVLHPGGYADQWLLRSEKDSRYTLYTSEAILAELTGKLTGKFHYDPGQVARLLSAMRRIHVIVRPTRFIAAVPNDPDDNVILECAVAAKADLIVSADPHLYKLKRFEDTQIVHPSALKYVFPEQWAA